METEEKPKPTTYKKFNMKWLSQYPWLICKWEYNSY